MTTVNPDVVIVHGGGCTDGFACAFAIHICAQSNPNRKYIYQNYKEPIDLELLRDRNVVIADFSFDRDIMLQMKGLTKSLQVYDHHVTAQKNLEGLDFCTFDMSRSGCQLVWDEYLGLDRPRHYLIDYTGDADLWTWYLNHSKEINAAIRSYPQDFESWGELSVVSAEDILTDGIAIIRYKQQVIDRHIKRAKLYKLCGYTVPGVCATIEQSEIGAKLAANYPFSFTWYDDGPNRMFSFRSSKIQGIDVEKIAQMFGGGGHANASGAKCAISNIPVEIELVDGEVLL